MKIKRVVAVDYGHVLPDYCGFCNQLHGHRANVIATFEGDVNVILGAGENGMVLDFSICKQIMTEKIVKCLDHGFAVWTDDNQTVVDFVRKRNDRFLICDLPPTAEYLAWWAFEGVNNGLKEYRHDDIKCSLIEWYETPNNVATCNKEDYEKLYISIQNRISERENKRR